MPNPLRNIDQAGDAVRRLLVDDVHKVWIDDAAPLPELDPMAMYHITTPKSARQIIEQGVLRPNATGIHWGGAAGTNSQGRAFFTSEPAVGRWVDMIGNRVRHSMDDPPEKLAVIQFRNPHTDFQEAMKRRLYERPADRIGRLMPTQDWAPPLYQDMRGSADAGANAFFFPGAVPLFAPPRVQRMVRRYSLLAPLALPAAAGIATDPE